MRLIQLQKKQYSFLGVCARPKRYSGCTTHGIANKGYLPILFDFERPTTKDFTEAIKILSGMSLFVIADITNPKSCPLELQSTVPDYMVHSCP